MSRVPVEIIYEGKTVVFEPSPNRVTYAKDKDATRLKRRAPRPPKAKPSQAKEDE